MPFTRQESNDSESADLVAAIMQASDGVVITDLLGNIQYVNPAFSAMTGYSRAEAVGQHSRVLKSGVHPQAVYQDLWDTIRNGMSWQGELINRRKDGTLYTEELRITPVKNGAGAVTRYLAIKRDVTGRREAEQAQRMLAAIVESSEDAIFAFSLDHIVLSWNEGAKKLFGYTADEIIGRDLSMLLPLERVPTLAQSTALILEKGTSAQWEGLGLHKAGHQLSLSVTFCPIRDVHGCTWAISVVLRDISERKQAEETRALLASIVEYSDDAILSALPDGTLVSWNRAAELLYGSRARK